MTRDEFTGTRRQFFGGLVAAVGASALYRPGFFADQLTQTAAQTEGPFYPDKMPLDTDNDLLIISNSITPAVGTVTHLSGRILDKRGDPIRKATVEIWQCDNNGAYLHSRSANGDKRDANFQGFGRFETGSTGEYRFRTIKPVPYPGRLAPHIHFRVSVKGHGNFSTQCYIKGFPGNEKDFVYNSVRDLKTRETLMATFAPMKGSRVGEETARFDIILGYTANA
jgi:protocatechuate 3,4-dioxygenase beta subunit